MKYLFDNFGKEKIIVILPLRRNNENNPYGDGTRTTLTPPLSDYCNYEKEYCIRNGVKYLDLYACEALNPNVPESEGGYFSDGLHPNDAGYKIITEQLCNFIKGL